MLVRTAGTFRWTTENWAGKDAGVIIKRPSGPIHRTHDTARELRSSSLAQVGSRWYSSWTRSRMMSHKDTHVDEALLYAE